MLLKGGAGALPISGDDMVLQCNCLTTVFVAYADNSFGDPTILRYLQSTPGDDRQVVRRAWSFYLSEELRHKEIVD